MCDYNATANFVPGRHLSIRRESGTRLPDALIAATALEHGLGLVTRNVSDFGDIRQLRLKNLA